jgi:peptidoglycan/xylan/chitin deacetylase (PgdA/CDA1 family)
MAERPIASLSLDLDNQWSYMKTHGDRGWKSLPSYLDVVVPRVLEFLEGRSLKITFFLVGQDAVQEENAGLLAAIAQAGHEIGNHSYHHEPWLASSPVAEIEAEIARAEEAIRAATGRTPVGFRGPGYSTSATLIGVLARRGYLYDASTIPTFVGPLARAYYFRTARLSAEEKRRRRNLFGSWRDGLRPIRPHILERDGRRIVEIPVTTMPLVRLPIHLSYVLYLSRYSPRLARAYAAAAVRLCLATGTEPSLLLHPLDFLGADDIAGLDFFPAMDLPGRVKRQRVGEILDLFGAMFQWVSLEEHARYLLSAGRLPVRRYDGHL